MKALKYIPRLIDIDIQEITLLSMEEYKSAQERIKPLTNWWWLRSPGGVDCVAVVVLYNGSVAEFGINVADISVSIRPALRLKSDNLQLGDKFHFGGYDWTVISENLALCNTEFGKYGKMAFQEDWEAEDANIYEKSDIKKYLDEWLEEMTHTERKNRMFGDKE